MGTCSVTLQLLSLFLSHGKSFLSLSQEIPHDESLEIVSVQLAAIALKQRPTETLLIPSSPALPANSCIVKIRRLRTGMQGKASSSGHNETLGRILNYWLGSNFQFPKVRRRYVSKSIAINERT